MTNYEEINGRLETNEESRKQRIKNVLIIYLIISVVVASIILSILIKNAKASHDELIACNANGWSVYNNHCYYISDDTLDWNSSKQWCSQHASNLLIIDNQSEFTLLEKILAMTPDKFCFWTGLIKDTKSDQLKWYDGAEAPKNQSWWYPSNKPISRSTKTCVSLCYMNRLWLVNDECFLNMVFICEKVRISLIFEE